MAVKTFITDERGKRLFAVVPIKEYNKLINKIEDLNDIIAFDKAMNRKKKFIPLKDA